MDAEESTKRASSRSTSTLPFTQLNQIDSDYALAVALQEQERAFTILPTIESDSNDDETLISDDDDDTENENEDDADGIFRSLEVEAELEFLEDDEDNNLEMEEDEIDPDELSYEELIALGEIVGEENKGLSLDQIFPCLSPFMFQSSKCKNAIDRCVVCQVEYEEGEKLVALSCEHPYHLECISKWLQIKKICPICSFEISPPPKIAS